MVLGRRDWVTEIKIRGNIHSVSLHETTQVTECTSMFPNFDSGHPVRTQIFFKKYFFEFQGAVRFTVRPYLFIGPEFILEFIRHRTDKFGL